jgi:predicted MFS family arabinose efflux permease
LALRFFGLFLVMPLIALGAMSLEGATPFLAGCTVGGYAFMQMIFQYPFGALSDRLGRKKMIAIGMVIFAAGSVVCAISDSVWLLIVGRFIQGAGAVSSVITATIGDLVIEENRSKAMALMGASIALSFIIALPVGLIVGGTLGISTLFWGSAALTLPALVILKWGVPNPPRIIPLEAIAGSKLKHAFSDRNLARLNIAMFLHSFVMTSVFLFIPIVLTREHGFAIGELWKVYLPALACGISAMAIGTMIGEKKNAVKAVMLAGIALLIAVFLSLALMPQMIIWWIMLIFVGINSLEPLMQSSATKFARADERGSALGVFNACQFCGIFVGGMCAGFIYGDYGLPALAIVLCALCMIWFALTLNMANPVKTQLLAIAPKETNLRKEQIESISGVHECYMLEGEKIYIRFNPRAISNEKLRSRLLDYAAIRTDHAN